MMMLIRRSLKKNFWQSKNKKKSSFGGFCSTLRQTTQIIKSIYSQQNQIESTAMASSNALLQFFLLVINIWSELCEAVFRGFSISSVSFMSSKIDWNRHFRCFVEILLFVFTSSHSLTFLDHTTIKDLCNSWKYMRNYLWYIWPRRRWGDKKNFRSENVIRLSFCA